MDPTQTKLAWILGSTISLLVAKNKLHKRTVPIFLNFPFLFGHSARAEVVRYWKIFSIRECMDWAGKKKVGGRKGGIGASACCACICEITVSIACEIAQDC